jgi:hypothetical protein
MRKIIDSLLAERRALPREDGDIAAFVVKHRHHLMDALDAIGSVWARRPTADACLKWLEVLRFTTLVDELGKETDAALEPLRDRLWSSAAIAVEARPARKHDAVYAFAASATTASARRTLRLALDRAARVWNTGGGNVFTLRGGQHAGTNDNFYQHSLASSCADAALQISLVLADHQDFLRRSRKNRSGADKLLKHCQALRDQGEVAQALEWLDLEIDEGLVAFELDPLRISLAEAAGDAKRLRSYRCRSLFWWPSAERLDAYIETFAPSRRSAARRTVLSKLVEKTRNPFHHDDVLMLLAAHGTRRQVTSYWTKYRKMIELNQRDSPNPGKSDQIIQALAPAYPAIACMITRAAIRSRLDGARTMRKRTKVADLLERAKALAGTGNVQPDHAAFLTELRQKHPRKTDRILQRQPVGRRARRHLVRI